MRLKTTLRSAAVALLVATAGLAAAHPTNVGAWSCPLEYLASGPVHNGPNQEGTVYLIKDDCDGMIFGRTSTPLWNSNVFTSLSDGGKVVAKSGSWLFPYTWLTTGGHVDTPEVAPVSGHTYSADGEIYTDAVIAPIITGDWQGQTTSWTAP